jgi:hypothetical protein
VQPGYHRRRRDRQRSRPIDWAATRRFTGLGLCAAGAAMFLVGATLQLSEHPPPPAPAPVAVAPTAPANPGPSFSCVRVTSAVLQLVCANPELSAYDRRIARLYAAARRVSRHRLALRNQQRAWIRTCTNGPADVARLRGLYLRRIAELEVIVGP